MKAADAKRSVVLIEAHEALPDFEKHLGAAKTDGSRGIAVDLGRVEGDLIQPDVTVNLDVETVRKLLPTMRDLIEAELKSLGVEL